MPAENIADALAVRQKRNALIRRLFASPRVQLFGTGLRTNDDLLLGGMERYEARSVVASAVERKLREWSVIAHID